MLNTKLIRLPHSSFGFHNCCYFFNLGFFVASLTLDFKDYRPVDITLSDIIVLKLFIHYITCYVRKVFRMHFGFVEQNLMYRKHLII